MAAIVRETVAIEIERLRLRYLRMLEIEEEPPVTWAVRGDILSWYVVLHDALEPDVDVEILADAAVVRAVVGARIFQCVLAIPRALRPDVGATRFREGVLEVRLVPRGS
jgi:hypothetical protein